MTSISWSQRHEGTQCLALSHGHPVPLPLNCIDRTKCNVKTGKKISRCACGRTSNAPASRQKTGADPRGRRSRAMAPKNLFLNEYNVNVGQQKVVHLHWECCIKEAAR